MRIYIDGKPGEGKSAVARLLQRTLEIQGIDAAIDDPENDTDTMTLGTLGKKLEAISRRKVEITIAMRHAPVIPALFAQKPYVKRDDDTDMAAIAGKLVALFYSAYPEMKKFHDFIDKELTKKKFITSAFGKKFKLAGAKTARHSGKMPNWPNMSQETKKRVKRGK